MDNFKSSVILSNLMAGVQVRLGSSIPEIRTLASIVGEKFSLILDPSNKLVFEESVGALEQFEDVIFHRKVQEVVSENVLSGKMVVNGKDNDVDVKSPDLKKKKLDLDPDAPIFGQSSPSESEIESDTESLEPLDIEETVRERIAPPKYAKEVLDLLSAGNDDSDQVHKLEAALKHGKQVIDLKQDNLNEYSGTIAKRLLYCSESYAIEGFDKMKHNLLLSLLMNSTEFVSNYNISQRFEILNALCDCAVQLSNRALESRENTPEKPMIMEVSKYPVNTRVWSHERKAELAKENKFVKHAENFFYPLCQQKILSINDGFLLAKLVETLGTFVYCCGSDVRGQKMAKELFELLWAISQLRGSIKIKKEEEDTVTIRRSVLLTMYRMFSVLSQDSIVQDYANYINDFIQWLSSVIQNDQDVECKDLALRVVRIIQNSVTSIK